MGNTTSTTKKLKHDDNDAFRRERLKTWDNHGATPWSDLNHDVLFLVMMKLGVIDFVSFSGVCKSWSSLARPNMEKFMASKPPMLMEFRLASRIFRKKEWYFYLKDGEGRKFKTMLPQLAGRKCIGLNCGYFILFGRATKDFWLVNPITKHQLHFPDFPSIDKTQIEYEYPSKFMKGILVFSPSTSEWIFIMLDKFKSKIWFCIAGNRAWNHISTTLPIVNLHVFTEKIYVLTTSCELYEMRLNPEPKLTSLDIKNSWTPPFGAPEIVSSGETLYLINISLEYKYKVRELDFGVKKWVMPKKTIEKYAFFISSLVYSVFVTLVPWADHQSQYQRYVDYYPKNSRKYRFTDTRNMWYFPHKCMNVDLIAY